MTTQSLPISKTSRDYYISALVVAAIAVVSALGVYFTHPVKLRTDAYTELLGLKIPNMQGIIMRQPRMSIVIFLSITIFVVGFIFITREALPFFSRRVAWGSVLVVSIGMVALAVFNADGRSGGWFRFLVLCFSFLLFSTVLTEAMVFYRRFVNKSVYKNMLWHRIVFGVACALLIGLMSGAYFHFGVENGAILDYGTQTSIPNTDNGQQQQNPIGQVDPTQSIPVAPPSPLGDGTTP